jgi:hypothetical protein
MVNSTTGSFNMYFPTQVAVNNSPKEISIGIFNSLSSLHYFVWMGL